MIKGVLITESLRVGTSLENLNLTVTKINRVRPGHGTTPDQPDIWTLLDFEGEETQAEELAQTFAGVLDRPGLVRELRVPGRKLHRFPGPDLPLSPGRQGRPGRSPGIRTPAPHPGTAAGLDSVRRG